jgi:hypothetical protein
MPHQSVSGKEALGGICEYRTEEDKIESAYA